MVSYGDLPLEIIANIYKYLDISDIKAAQLTCYQWLNASCLREVQDRSILVLTSVNINAQQLFQESFRSFPNVRIIWENSHDQDINQLIEFFSIKNISDNIRYLVLENITDSNIFCEILELLPILEELKCIKEESVEVVSLILQNPDIISHFTFTNIRSLSLACDSFTDTVLEIFSEIRNLQELNIQTTENTRHVYFSKLPQILKNNENYLTKLTLDHGAVDALFQSQHHLLSLKVKEISLKFNFEDNPDFIDFFKAQNFITSLNLVDFDDGINDTKIVEVLKNLPLLEKLDIEGNHQLSDITIFQISKLKNLKCLNINHLHKIGDDGIVNGLAKDKNFKIIELKCENTNLSGEAYRMISENLPNLQRLQCGYFELNDGGIQHIMKNCKNLIELNILTDKITSYDITGIDFNTGEKTGSSLSELEKLECLKLRSYLTDKEFLRIQNTSNEEFLSKLKLKNLKVLHLGFLPFTKEKSGMQCFNLVSAFMKNSPNIKELSLTAFAYWDKNRLRSVLEIIMKKLTNLERLYITIECENLSTNVSLFKDRTDLSIIYNNCTCDVCIKVKSLCYTFTEDLENLCDETFCDFESVPTPSSEDLTTLYTPPNMDRTTFFAMLSGFKNLF